MHHLQHHAHRAGLAVPELAASSTCLASVGASGAAPAGLSPPHRDETPRLAGAEGFRDQDKADTAIVADLDGERKVLTTLRAQLETCGCGLHEMADRGYFVSLGNLSGQPPDLRAVRQMLVQIGGRA